jgi:hypothetical protein
MLPVVIRGAKHWEFVLACLLGCFGLHAIAAACGGTPGLQHSNCGQMSVMPVGFKRACWLGDCGLHVIAVAGRWGPGHHY